MSSAVAYQTPDWLGAEPCHGLVLYEDVPARELALQLCGDLVTKFQSDLDFQFEWCGFNYLALAEIGIQMGKAALNADLVFISLHRAVDLPVNVISWLEFWLIQRNGPGLLALLQTSTETPNAFSWQDHYVRSLAMRAKLDYLPYFVARTSVSAGDRLREDHVAPDRINELPTAGQHQHSSGWGINE